MGATWTYAFFWAGRHFTEISFFGRPACHLANVLAPKVGCALKCAAWAGDPTPKQHPKASSGLWAMGLEMANSVAIAADDKFIKFIKNVQKICNRPMNAPKNVHSNYMQPHACAGGHPNTLLKFSTFDSDPGAVPQILEAAMGPMGLRHVWPFVLAPSGRSWQTHAWGCCQHVWALCHALGCTLPTCFGMLTLFGGHLGISLSQLGFWRFFAIFGQPACQLSCSVPPKGGWP
mgnify:FL=1